jgi:hypothetical protein
MQLDQLSAGPKRARLARRLVTDRENEIERRSTRAAEFVPVFRPKSAHVEIHLAQKVERVISLARNVPQL